MNKFSYSCRVPSRAKSILRLDVASGPVALAGIAIVDEWDGSRPAARNSEDQPANEVLFWTLAPWVFDSQLSYGIISDVLSTCQNPLHLLHWPTGLSESVLSFHIDNGASTLALYRVYLSSSNSNILLEVHFWNNHCSLQGMYCETGVVRCRWLEQTAQKGCSWRLSHSSLVSEQVQVLQTSEIFYCDKAESASGSIGDSIHFKCP